MRRKSNSPEITIIGCGTPTPLPDRFGSSYVIDIGGEKLLFDCGPATTWKLIKAGISPTEINSVFFTHHHFDHDADFPTFILTRWDQMVPKDRLLKVYGPTMTEEFTRGIIDEDTKEEHHTDEWRRIISMVFPICNTSSYPIPVNIIIILYVYTFL